MVFGYGDVNASICLLFSGNMVLAGKWRCYDIPAMGGRRVEWVWLLDDWRVVEMAGNRKRQSPYSAREGGSLSVVESWLT